MKLKKEEYLTIINDHDPLPLFYQFKAERSDLFEWQYLEKGPETWKVAITEIKDEGKTVADILLKNPKAANVFNKYHIDYCCKGSRLLRKHVQKQALMPTDNYNLPEDSCTSYRLLFNKLKDFEKDLHQHVHLENNIFSRKL